jgi:SsrA-binding protein
MPLTKLIVSNKKAYHNFEIFEVFEAGVSLCGTEVKSLRAARAEIAESFIKESKNELYLINSYIPEYKQGNQFNHIPSRPRKLLLKKSEILKITQKVNVKGLTVVPLKLYFKKSWVKLEIAICRGRQKWDKRQNELKKESQKELAKIKHSINV